ncbi:ATP-binding cassette domain-containing protein [Roseomonas nepalensis]|uniref:ATP-binding cassette domain-containing protein n=1 Tax=Muricoccus nepalensis TaxID=1854500 RepID=A0A502FXN5_9PROT|nr:branched-chain amino acid ABC transporter ATP-binding protein/permease [Roseomonas nepalensis]TPG53826.1 ATP-binding cassette domain-containing protein [Roseomonas nepalensis]
MSSTAEAAAAPATLSVPSARAWRGLPSLALAIVAVLVASSFAPTSGYILNMVMQAATYAIGVAGLVVVLGYCGQISLAQAAFFGLGAYGVGIGATDYGLPFLVALLIGVGVATGFGIALGLASLRLGGHYLAMVTISFQQIVTLVLTNWIGLTHGPDGIKSIPRPSFPGLHLDRGDHYLALCLVVLMVVTWYAWRLKTSRLGRAMQAVRDNEIAASTCGIDVFRTKVLAFGISALLGGLGGGLFAGAFAYISPDQFAFGESIVLLTMALLGGVQSPFGALLGTTLLVLLPEWLRFLKNIYLAVYGAAVILIMVFLPDGLWGLVTNRLRRATPIEGTVPPLPLLSQRASASGEPALEIAGLAKHFGGLKALDGVDLTVRRGAVHALIGPNGSGKTTFINVATGLYRPTAGRIRLAGQDLTAAAPHERTRRGLARTFQNIRVFRGMTVLENVMIGAERPGNDIAEQPAAVVGRALAALDFVGLRGDANRLVGTLSYGHQRYVEIARALAGNPHVLLLDEPAAGLNMTEKGELGALLRRLKGHGLTILIVDHDMNLVEQVADHITVLNFGRRIADGSPRDVLSDPDVIAAYLGEPRENALA